MEFREANDEWTAVPRWVLFLLELGYRWKDVHDQARRVALVSMPTDSAAAGLISLGLMRRCLEFEDANDADAHHGRLCDLARTGPRGVELRHITRPGRWIFDGLECNRNPVVLKLNDRGRTRWTITKTSASQWRLFNESPVEIIAGKEVLNANLYEQLIPNGGKILPTNLTASHSSICLAGRASGGAETKSWMSRIKFRESDRQADLSQLLLVHEWNLIPGTISRVRVYNTRTEKFDRESGAPEIVVADGDAAFLKVLANTAFEDCDVIGVTHRTIEREKLEAVGNKLSVLRQWYRPGDSLLCKPLEPPRGVTISVLTRRA